LITPDRLTIGGLAKQHGYRTACIGKWHLGWDWPIPQDRAKLFRDNEGNKDEVVATDAHRAVWKEVFSQPIGGGPTAVGLDAPLSPRPAGPWRCLDGKAISSQSQIDLILPAA
jgi:hypothetical protein